MQLANECTHEQDLIMECANVDYSQKQVPPKGTLRLMNSLNTPTTINVGRLEMFREGRWGSVCNLGFSERSA